MNNDSDTPFWGKQKPLRHYFKNGSLSFSVREGKLFCKVTRTTKTSKETLYSFEIIDKAHLDLVLSNKEVLT